MTEFHDKPVLMTCCGQRFATVAESANHDCRTEFHPYRQAPHEFAGTSKERQEVGDPGHCEDCCSVGHIAAHPELGCGDVGCNRDHLDIDREDTCDD